MDQKIVSKSQMDFTIDSLITMTVEELAEDLNEDPADILADFCVSKTGKALYDTSTKFWWNGPSYLADVYKAEKQVKEEKEMLLFKGWLDIKQPMV